MNALNMPTHDYNAAKNTYANRGLIDYKYYDFNGNIFDSYEEARQSIINSKTSTGVLFYNNLEISPTSETIKFNPLSKKDLLKFKKIAFQNAATTFSGSKKTNFDLKIYSGNSDTEFKNIIDVNFIHKIIVEAINHYFETKMKLLSNSRFDITLSLIDDGGGIYCNYVFSDLRTKDPNNIKLLESKKMIFKNVSFNDIEKFNCFLNRSEFAKQFEITDRIRGIWVKNYMAEEAKTNNFLNTSFKIKHIGDNQGDALPLGSSDYKILTHGDAKGRNFLSFDVNIKIRNNVNRESFETQFRNIIKSYISNLESQSKSLVGKIRHGIFDQVLNNLLNNDWKFDIDSLFWEGFKYSGQANMNELRTIKSNVVSENWFLKGWTAADEDNKPLLTSSDNGLKDYCEKLNRLKYKKNSIDM
ncbi:MAG: hypothetical protein K2I49_00785, partial [Ureaplasma sp.]|nr:hypothetical protein [Ureaplasma sp.]